MRKVFNICAVMFCSLSLFGMSKQDSVYKKTCETLDFPILYIVTEDSVMPTYSVVYAPEGCHGVGITNNEKVPARMVMIQHNDTIYDTGVYAKGVSGLTIKVRGNTTAADPIGKKPYKLKLQKKKDLLFRNNESVYADKDWVLLRYALCETMVGNMTNRALGMDWTPAQQPVFVFLNDNFRGVYLLTECINRNQNCRVNISKTGYLFEYDAYWWNEDYYIESSPRFMYNYTLKYPDPEDILPAQTAYLTAHIGTVEDYYLTPDRLDSVIDIRSYAKWLWVQDMLGNWDYGGSNMYLIKYDETTASKQAMMCAWDFDGCFTSDMQWSHVHDKWWFHDFFSLPQPQFIGEYINLYDNKVKDVFTTLVEDINDLRSTPMMTTLDTAFALDNQRWELTAKPANQRFKELADYLTARKPVINNLMQELKTDYANMTTALPSIIPSDDQEQQVYDMLGRPIRETQSGFMIIRKSDGSVTKVLNK